MPAERFAQFAGLPALLKYLKMCAHSVLLDAARQQRGNPIEPLSAVATELAEPRTPEGQVVSSLAGRELWLAIAEELQDDAEREVAYLSFARDLKPREEEGPALEAGKSYALAVDPTWPDAAGRPLLGGFRKTFRVGPPDGTQPDAKTWAWALPKAGTREPLSLTLTYASALPSGRLDIRTRRLRQGGSIGVWEVELHAEGSDVVGVHAIVTMARRPQTPPFAFAAMPAAPPPESLPAPEMTMPGAGQHFGAQAFERRSAEGFPPQPGPDSRSLVWVRSRRGAWDKAREDRLLKECNDEVQTAAQAYLDTRAPGPEQMFDHLYARLPAALQRQRAAALGDG